MHNQKDSTDKLLVTANSTVLIGFVFVFGISQLSKITKWTLLISFVLYVISLCLLLWNFYRLPKRRKLLDELREKTVKKYSARIASFIEEIAVPLARLKAKDEMLGKLGKVKNKEEHEELMKAIDEEIKLLEEGKINIPHTPEEEKATHYVVESFVEQIGHASQEDYNKAFKQPLKENQAKLKYRIDRIALRGRRHVFVSASVF
jgi:membrane protein implicated in regulation of membrane protease activity